MHYVGLTTYVYLGTYLSRYKNAGPLGMFRLYTDKQTEIALNKQLKTLFRYLPTWR